MLEFHPNCIEEILVLFALYLWIYTFHFANDPYKQVNGGFPNIKKSINK